MSESLLAPLMYNDNSWPVYADSLVETPEGEVWAGPGAPTLPSTEDVFVLTAHNPGRRLDDTENTFREAELARAVQDRGWFHATAIGLSRDRKWSEQGLAVWGVPLQDVLALARSFGQDAIFRLTADSLEVVACQDGTVRGRRMRDT